MPDIRRFAVGALAASATAFVVPAVVAPQTAAAYRYGERSLERGDYGRDVRTAQVFLRRTVARRLTVDSAFGRRTERALKRFERRAELRRDGRLSRREAPTLREKADEAERRATVDAEPAPPEEPAVPVEPEAEGEDAEQTLTGGTSPADPVGVAGEKAVVNPDGTATAPVSAPQAVKDIIEAGNEIAKKPYVYGGGHGEWKARGYDCSGSVSYALHGAGLLKRSMPSGGFMDWGERGRGEWVTIYAKGSHMYMVVAGIRFDTSGANPSRWQTDMRSARGYSVRHPKGL